MFCALLAKISGERLQDHWSSGFVFFLLFWHFRRNSANFSAKCLFGKVAFRQNGFSAEWFSAMSRAS